MADVLAALAVVAVLAGAALQAATGSGLALVAGPALVAVLDPAEAVTTLLVVATATTLLLLLVRRGDRPAVRWPDVRVLLVPAVPGVVAGALVLAVVSKPVLQVVVGLGVLGAVGLQVLRRGADVRPPSLPATAAAGLAAGLLTTTTGTNGPPLVLWLQRRGTTPVETRDTLGALFLGLNLLGAVALGVAGRAGQAFRPEVVLPLLAVAVAGHAAGRRAFHLLDARRFGAAALCVSALAGAASVVAGLT